MIENSEQAIFLIKPDGMCRTFYSRPLPELMEGLLQSSGLNVVRSNCILLNEEDIMGIYPMLNTSDRISEELKTDLISHIRSNFVKTFLLEGPNAEGKAKIIRNYLRIKLTDLNSDNGRVIENLIHVTDAEDFETTLAILFENNKEAKINKY